MNDSRVTLGRIIGVHGLAGELVVKTESDDPLNLRRYRSFQWNEPGGRQGRTRSIEMTECRVHRGAALVSFEGIEGREAAEELVGGTLCIPRSELLPPPDDAFYVADLMGLTVVTVAGETVGPLTAVYPGNGHDVYGVDKGGREVLIPAVEPIVVAIDLNARQMTIDPPEGLLD
ncbi:MAG: ribosome maturation factor RimM [Candidatus Eisenbacteria bacterium]|nr:ribosome maturation factor RimM [Candidatus Eisenbacteria bacterium]